MTEYVEIFIRATKGDWSVKGILLGETDTHYRVKNEHGITEVPKNEGIIYITRSEYHG